MKLVCVCILKQRYDRWENREGGIEGDEDWERFVLEYWDEGREQKIDGFLLI
jgi:hypothetical protein